MLIATKRVATHFKYPLSSLYIHKQTVILDPTGKVIANYNHDAAVGRSVDEILRIVQAFQYVEKHGEVCPAGWTPGKKTMKDDVNIAQKEYFSQLK
jgi:peroxiredoxin 1